MSLGLTLDQVREEVHEFLGTAVTTPRKALEDAQKPVVVLTRQGVRRRLAELRTQAKGKGSGKLRGKIEELEIILFALPQHDAIPELGSALVRISVLEALLKTTNELIRKWNDGEVSDEEFIAQVQAITF